VKAMVTTQYGSPDVLQLREIAIPTPAEDEVLIKLYASSVNPLDSFVIRGPLFSVPVIGRLLKPKHKIAGADVAGRVESVGRDVKQFRPGDEVFGASFGKRGLGGFAEYACAVEDCLARKPANLSFAEAVERICCGGMGTGRRLVHGTNWNKWPPGSRRASAPEEKKIFGDLHGRVRPTKV
jgi:NADPH:quinone reductase-like Zn-dependent oxidoreductase